jgi:hypothetical protein
MMTRRADISARLPICLGLPIPEAAAAIGVSEGHFRKMQDMGMMPRPRDVAGVPRIDTDELARAFKALPHVGTASPSVEVGVDGWHQGDTV